MTLTGYKPALILPWYTVENNTTDNETQTNSERKVLGEPGPLRIMVYTGPIIMGVGFFGVMMAVGLFCEIKDRYLMAILPTKCEIRKTKKDMMYDMLINEFRKNYFRGIEVPIRKEDDKKHGFNIPNIKQKSENVELEILPHVNQSVMENNEAKDLQDFKMTTEVSSKEDMSDARRNTEPGALFQLTLGSNSSKSSEYISQTTKHKSTTTKLNRTIEPSSINKRRPCTFKTVIRVFHSESSLSSSQGLTNFVQNLQDDTLSIDSLELTDEMLKNFEMANISHI